MARARPEAVGVACQRPMGTAGTGPQRFHCILRHPTNIHGPTFKIHRVLPRRSPLKVEVIDMLTTNSGIGDEERDEQRV